MSIPWLVPERWYKYLVGYVVNSINVTIPTDPTATQSPYEMMFKEKPIFHTPYELNIFDGVIGKIGYSMNFTDNIPRSNLYVNLGRCQSNFRAIIAAPIDNDKESCIVEIENVIPMDNTNILIQKFGVNPYYHKELDPNRANIVIDNLSSNLNPNSREFTPSTINPMISNNTATTGSTSSTTSSANPMTSGNNHNNTITDTTPVTRGTTGNNSIITENNNTQSQQSKKNRVLNKIPIAEGLSNTNTNSNSNNTNNRPSINDNTGRNNDSNHSNTNSNSTVIPSKVTKTNNNKKKIAREQPIITDRMTTRAMTSVNFYKMSNKDKNEALRKELTGLIGKDVIKAVDPKLKFYPNVNRSMVIYREKILPDNSKEWRSRLCVRGDQEKIPIDEIISSPTADVRSVYALLASCNQSKYKMLTWDVKNAFLNTPMNKECYLFLDKEVTQEYIGTLKSLKKNNEAEEASSFVTDKGELIMLVQKALYGLKEAPYLWYKLVNKLLLENGFTCCEDDSCLYKKSDSTGNIFLCIHVDDFLVCSTSESLTASTKQILEKEFNTLKELTEPNFRYLGINISRNNNNIELDQKDYITELIQEYGITKGESTPCTHLLYKDEGGDINDSKFKSLVAKLMFLATRTRPDIAFAVMYSATKSAKPKTSNWNSLLNILSYLKSTINKKLRYKPITNNNLVLYTDASHNLHGDSMGHTGFDIYLGNDEALLTWRSIKNHIHAQGSYHAELVAIDEGTKTMERMINIMKFIVDSVNAIIRSDNDPALTTLSKTMPCTECSKAINNRVNGSKLRINEYQMVTQHCPTATMIADIHTKVLRPVDFRRHAKSLLNYD
jgi:hypothetical protein